MRQSITKLSTTQGEIAFTLRYRILQKIGSWQLDPFPFSITGINFCGHLRCDFYHYDMFLFSVNLHGERSSNKFSLCPFNSFYDLSYRSHHFELFLRQLFPW